MGATSVEDDLVDAAKSMSLNDADDDAGAQASGGAPR